ncbi:MAG: helix-turn-helix domain-containing protein [Kiritimatiellia bacterium]
MKYRKRQNFRVAYGFAGQLQEAMEVYQGFLEPASERGWQVIALQEQFEIQLRRLIELRAVDAVVGDFISRIWVKTLPPDLPVVQLGGRLLAEDIPSVCLNETEIGKKAAAHFEEMGYTSLLYFSPRMSPDICGGAGLEWVRSTESLRDRIRAQSEVGVLCASDFLVRRGLQVARSLELGVPEDIGFVGIGNRTLDGILADRGISSFPIPYAEMGRAAAGVLAESVNETRVRHVQISPGELRVRQSSVRRSDAGRLRHPINDLLHTRLADPPPVADWARRLGMSRRSFERSFADECGVTPYEYLLQLRTREAQRLLEETDWTIARIGETVGIPDPARFSAFFKKRCGITAVEWRRSGGRRTEAGGHRCILLES